MASKYKGILKEGYPIFDLNRLPERVLTDLKVLDPGLGGSVTAYECFFMYRSKVLKTPMFWGPREEHRKPVFNNDGDIVKMRNIAPANGAWRVYAEFSPEQKRVLGWIPANERR